MKILVQLIAIHYEGLLVFHLLEEVGPACGALVLVAVRVVQGLTESYLAVITLLFFSCIIKITNSLPDLADILAQLETAGIITVHAFAELMDGNHLFVAPARKGTRDVGDSVV